MIALLAVLTPETELAIPLTALGVLITTLIGVTWRAANYARDNRDEMRGLREEMRSTWSLRDQELWVLQLERENRARNIDLFVPDVRRAPRGE